MPKRIKCETCSTGWCKNHLFQLKPTHNDLYFRKPQKIRLCPRFDKNARLFLSSLPRVNKDQKYYTPTFILEEQLTFYKINDQTLLQTHEEKIGNLQQEGRTQIIEDLRNPSTFLSYCS